MQLAREQLSKKQQTQWRHAQADGLEVVKLQLALVHLSLCLMLLLLLAGATTPRLLLCLLQLADQRQCCTCTARRGGLSCQPAAGRFVQLELAGKDPSVGGCCCC